MAIYPVSNNPRQISTLSRQDFDLAGAKEFCKKIAAGEIKLEDLQAAYDAEDAAKEQAAILDVTERAKKFHARLDAMGLKYRDLLELEVLAHSLGDMGHNSMELALAVHLARIFKPELARRYQHTKKKRTRKKYEKRILAWFGEVWG